MRLVICINKKGNLKSQLLIGKIYIIEEILKDNSCGVGYKIKTLEGFWSKPQFKELPDNKITKVLYLNDNKNS